LYESGKIRHAGTFRDLEDELTAFSTVGYTGGGSPNRADAWIWVLAELFPGLVKGEKAKSDDKAKIHRVGNELGWMA
jgi:phage terminase large subunit-like protein